MQPLEAAVSAPVRSAPASWRTIKAVAVRLGANVVTLLVISAIAFLLMNFKSPEDIARSVLGREVSADQIAVFVADNRLDMPIPARYLDWVGHAVRGDLGKSIVTGRDVSADVFPRLGRSLILAALGATVGIAGGIMLGVFLARRIGSKSDFRIVTSLLVLASMPEFLIGIALYFMFVIWLAWFPTQSGLAFAFGTFQARAVTFVLPAATIALLLMPHIARVARVVTAEALSAPYVDAARLRGLADRTVHWDHAFRNAAVPLASVIGVNLVYAISGVVVVEYLFGFPGIGSLLVQSIGSGDLFQTQAIIMMFAVIIVLVNMAVDIAVLLLNPRLRLRG